MKRRRRAVLSLVVLALLAVACSRERDDQPDTPVAQRTPTEPARAITAVPATPTPEPSPTPTPAPTPSPGAPPTPTPTPSPTPRVMNGLQIVDETSVWVVRESGGLRIRSAPTVTPDNVVGSVPQNTEVNVLGRVLNGQEAQTGGGTVWLIVAPNQYMYAAPGAVERAR